MLLARSPASGPGLLNSELADYFFIFHTEKGKSENHDISLPQNV